ncbi:NUDIX domain-containing protein [uncultured Maribacter sp.]|uniref:NUDIX hydrolase n=1 Tax=uncultured Maribacter sp. TaxID=431308 RepID=UPI00261F3EE4|nr:NUDIX domain-containing protein [uncultured Maribacter sp.]
MKLLDTSLKYDVEQKILVAVDCIIFGFDSKNLKLLLFKRKVEPLKGKWSLVGAFVKNDLSIKNAAKQILLESTGLKDIYLEELKTYGNVERDPGERVISIAHYSLIGINDFDIEHVKEFDAEWFNIDEMPDLILDHKQMVDDAIVELENKVRHQPIGFNLLPKYFTLPELQTLYECIYQRPLDSRNFRKKILSLNILIKTDKKDRSNSKKGAFLYCFNKEMFDELIAKGYNFEI